MQLESTETGFAYMLEAHKTGGPYMKVITILAVTMLLIIVWKVWEIFGRKRINFKLLDLILMAGSLAAAIGIFSQIVGIVQALEAIRAAADISPQIVMGGAIISFYAPIWGFMVFIMSLLTYFVLKEIVKNKSVGAIADRQG